MSVAQALRRAAAPLRSCAARYLGDAASSSKSFYGAALDVRASQCFLARMLSTEIDNNLISQTQASADHGSPQATHISQQDPIPRLVLQRTGDPNSSRTDVSSAPYLPPASGSQKVSARIMNIPRFMFKSDLLWFLKGCNLRPEDLVFMYDVRYRTKYIQASFSSVESFRLAQRSLAMKGRLGGRYLRLTQEEPQTDDLNAFLEPYRGRSLLMLKLPINVILENVERFFAGYTLDNNYPVKFMRSTIQAPTVLRRPPVVPARSESDTRALVRFKTQLEALRALREKQGSFCIDMPAELRFIE